MAASPSDELLQQLLDQNSVKEVEELASTSPDLTATLKKHMLTILKKHIAEEAWHDALACVDRRVRSKKRRAAFEEDYQNGAVADPKNRDDWDLKDLCVLVKIVDRLLLHVGDVGTDKLPGRRHETLESWESSWERRRPDGHPDAHPLGDDAWQEEDQGTEHPGNFKHAFSRHVGYHAANDRPLFHEGVAVDEATRPKLQRAFFRLEHLRRAYYSRPLFPRGARYQSRDSTLDWGEAQSVAGETAETRLERAEKVFRGWKKSDFVEITCAFKATLNLYAVPTSHMMSDFVGLMGRTQQDSAVRSALEFYAEANEELEENAEAVGLQWERDPITGRREMPLWNVETDAEWLDFHRRFHEDQRDLERHKRREILYLKNAEFDDLGCTIFKTDVIRPRHPSQRRGRRELRVLAEGMPDAEMSKFFHALCSLPLRFLDGFMDMPTRRRQRFLKTTYHAVARVKASHASRFLSGEISAWSSKPADEEGGPRHWDHRAERRVFPELSVRHATLACVGLVYRLDQHPYGGWGLTHDRFHCSWWYDDLLVTPLVWKKVRSEIKYRPFDINSVFLMSDQSWQGLWRSTKRYERLIWTGPRMQVPRWEGYGHPGRLDPNECYCHVGEGCGLCTPLPPPKNGDVEWELFTEDDWEAEYKLEKEIHAPSRRAYGESCQDQVRGGKGKSVSR